MKNKKTTLRHSIKRIRLASLLVAALPLLCASQTAVAAPPSVTLSHDGNARLAITLVDPAGDLFGLTNTPPLQGLAGASAADLKAYMQKLSGAEFEMISAKAYPGGKRPGIFVGLDKDLGFDGIDKVQQQYGLRTTADGQLIITGADARGISHGIYALLHSLGCRWYYPGDLWAVVPPPARSLSVAFEEIGGPDFYIQRRIWVGHGLHLATTGGDFPAWCRRNGMAQPFDVAIAHSWIGLDPANDFTNHPEWFALVNGERKTSKPCYSHPGVTERAKQTALNHFRNNPKSMMISVSAPDGLGFCSCDLCKKVAKVDELYEAQGVLFGRQPDGTEVSIASETIFNMANEVAKAVATEFPDKLIGIMAYSGYAHPPSFKLEPNIYLEVTAGYRRTPLTLPEQMTELGLKASALGVYEYYDVEQWSWDKPGSARASQLDSLQAAMRFYYRNNVRSVSGEMSNNFAPNGIGYYSIARMLWDADTDVRLLEESFYRDCFGPAAPAIKPLYRRWESGQGFDDRALSLAYRDLAEASKLAAGNQVQRDRVDRLRMYAHFLNNFLQVREGSGGGDIADWKKTYGEEGAIKRIEELGTWTARLIDTHMTHGWAFNRYFLRRGNDVGLDTSNWNRAGQIPAHEEVEERFQAGSKALSEVKALEVPSTIFSRRLVPLSSARVRIPGTESAEMQPPDSFRKATLELFAKAGEKVNVVFASTGTVYDLLLTPQDVYEDGGGSQYSTRIASGSLAGDTLVIEAEADGYYTLRWNDGTLKKLDHPHVLHAGASQYVSGTFHFFVPKGTERFIINAGAHGGLTIKIYDSAGKIVLDATPAVEKPQSRFVVEVPRGRDGGVWKVVGPNCINRTGSISFIGVPSYLAFSPHLLMVPQETIR